MKTILIVIGIICLLLVVAFLWAFIMGADESRKRSSTKDMNTQDLQRAEEDADQ